MTVSHKLIVRYTLATALICVGLSAGAQDIWMAARDGDVETLKVLVKEVESVDMVDPNFGFTPLFAAILGNQAEAVNLLIESGANVDQAIMGGNTPLHAAAFLGQIEIAKALLDAGANPATANELGQVPSQTLNTDWMTTQNIAATLQLTLSQEEVEQGRIEISELLEGALLEQSESDIWLATILGNTEAVRKLAKTTDIEARGLDGTIKLVNLAATMGHADIVEVLAEAGADLNSRAVDGATPLIAAALFGKIDVLNILLKHGADPTLSDVNGLTPLAAAQTDMQIVDYVAGLINLELDYDATIEGKREAVKVLQSL